MATIKGNDFIRGQVFEQNRIATIRECKGLIKEARSLLLPACTSNDVLFLTSLICTLTTLDGHLDDLGCDNPLTDVESIRALVDGWSMALSEARKTIHEVIERRAAEKAAPPKVVSIARKKDAN